MNAAYRFRLYIHGATPSSVRALANLYAICRKHFPGSHGIEVIDIEKEPMWALSDGIVATPTLLMISPAPELRIIGDLSDEEEVLYALCLPQEEGK